MSLFKKRLLRRIGTPPGTFFEADADGEKVSIDILQYNKDSYDEISTDESSTIKDYQMKKGVKWFNVNTVKDSSTIRSLGKAYGFHPLVMEDIADPGQRPKIEDHDDYIYIVVRMLHYNDDSKEIDSEQVSIIIGKDYVLTFQERKGDVFNIIRDRIKHDKGRVRTMGADYLAYVLIDAVVDNYFLILEKIGDELELLEDTTIDDPDEAVSHEIHRLKSEIIHLRKSIWPLRELISGFERITSSIKSKELNLFLRDIYDHTVQIIDQVEVSRDILSGIRDTYLTSISNRMNNVMKVLTIIATIFIPLTFVAGIYGMNFKYMPELEYKYSYPVVLGVMLFISLLMLYFFKKKKWL